MEDEPATAVTVPPQLLFTLFGLATTRPAGRPSAKEIPVRVAAGLGLTMVKLTLTLLFCPTLLALNALAIVGGAVGITVKLAVLLLPECTASAGYVPVMVCGLVATCAGVTVEVQVDAVLELGVSTHAGPKTSLGSDEPKPTVPSGLNDGL